MYFWELAHEPMPLQSRSAPSCCFHSSSESQHSQPHSLPSFTLLVLTRADRTRLCVFFSFVVVCCRLKSMWLQYVFVLKGFVRQLLLRSSVWWAFYRSHLFVLVQFWQRFYLSCDVCLCAVSTSTLWVFPSLSQFLRRLVKVTAHARLSLLPT